MSTPSSEARSIQHVDEAHATLTPTTSTTTTTTTATVAPKTSDTIHAHDGEHTSSQIPTDPAFHQTTASTTALECTATVWRMGEIFGEFGFSLKHPSTQVPPQKWHLRIRPENANDAVFDEEIFLEKQSTKVVKLKPSTAYFIAARVFSDAVNTWGPWSPSARTMTLASVVTSIHEIGEDYVRMLWDRPLRQDANIVDEIDKAATSAVADIGEFELRVVREGDMVQEFCDGFPTGVRTYTLHELRPATPYIVFVRYLTLIGTKKQWHEVCRFYTQASHDTILKRRGEDTFSVEWVRAPLADNTVGYLLPDSTIHKFEVSVEGDGADEQPIELAASTRQYTAKNLCPGASYSFRVRCLTKEGRWGARAKPLIVRTAERPTMLPIAIGETFLSVAWTRPHAETEETKAECTIASTSSNYRRTVSIDVGPDEKDKVFHIDGLTSGTTYELTMRTFLVSEWGLWTEPKRIRTSPKVSLVFKERGEDFITVDWANVAASYSEGERRVMSSEQRYLFSVSRLEMDGDRQPILEQEVRRSDHSDGLRIGSLVPDTAYEIKCTSWQRNPITNSEGWGEFSAPLVAQTLQSVVLQVLDVGEDFAQLSWRRSLRPLDSPRHHGTTLGSSTHQWMDLKYEIIVGCLDTGVEGIIHKEVLDTTYTISNLLPNTNYVISVRACDEQEQWGLWCRLMLRTLAAIDASIHEIGEDFVRLMWQRNERDGTADPTAQGLVGAGDMSTEVSAARYTTPRSAEQYVSQYAILVFSNDAKDQNVPHKEADYYRGGNSEVAILEYVASHHSSCRIGGLLPDREYVMVVRALTASGKWGLWSKPTRFRTISQFRIPVNFLSIGENYVHIVWNRDEHPTVDPDVVLGDFTVVSQQLRIVGVDTQYSKDHALNAEIRELKLYGLSPTTAYCIQLRSCSSSGEWGLWSAPVNILTRATITTRPVEVAEDYLVLSWERKRAHNPKNFPTGKGLVTSYHLRVSNVGEGICIETFLGDGDCPYRITGLKPDTYYCVELKANYNDEEWGLWSTPLWCLTMRHLDVKTQLISEEFCNVKIVRPLQNRRLPEDDGNRATEDRIIAFGQLRSHCMLCVTTPSAAQLPHAAGGAKATSRPSVSSALPPDCQGHRLVFQIELVSEQEELVHTIPNLKANTVYHASVRSKLDASEWGMWSTPSLRFATVPTIVVGFAAIGENYVTVDWRRGAQSIPPALLSKVQCGLGIISKSRLKIRDVSGGAATRIFDIDSSASQLYIDNLAPASTYAAAVQTFNDNHAWGMWSEEAKVRTVSSMEIHVEHIAEDAVWVSWNRQADITQAITHDTVLNVDAMVRNYEVKIIGEGNFCFTRELDSNKLFFRGLQPDTVYELKVRSLNKNDGHWGLWSSQYFRTQPMMRITFGNIGEHFAVVEWRRHLPTSVPWDATATSLVEAEDVVQEFRLKLELVGGDEAVIYELSPNVSSFRFTDLLPSSEYRVWMCAKGHEGVWGLWNQEARVRTLPQLDLTVKDIGEDYVAINWSRLKWEGTRAPDVAGVQVWEIDGAVSGYHIKVLSEDGTVFAQQHCGYTTTSCTMHHLQLKSVYAIQVCAKDTYNEWGLWSEARRFATLQPVKMNLLRIGEDHVNIEWGRRGHIHRRFITELASDAEDEGLDASGPISGDEGADEEGSNRGDGSLSPGAMGGALVSDDSFGSLQALEEDIIRGNETVKQWHIRVYGRRVFGGQPGAEDYIEFFTESAVTSYNITSLLPKATYSITVRAQNATGEWGHWCHAETVVTMPLLALDLEYIGETFMVASWTRPTHDHSHLVCFPPPTGIHNYQIQIRPLAAEEPFDESDEPLVNGARVYETTQPSLQLSNLLPGTRYRVVVREEMLDPLQPDLRPLVPDFGVFCEASVVETIAPTVIEPTEIGENFCAVAWGRKKRAFANTAGSDDASSTDHVTYVTTSKAKVIGYEIQALRLDDNADQVYKGPLALEVMRPFPSSTQAFQLMNLVPNGIYAIAARAQTDGGYWGLWSVTSKFVTQKRLTVRVELINEDSCVVSWARALPDWAAQQQQLRLQSATPDVEVASSFMGEEDENEAETLTNTDTNTPPPPANPLLENVIIGDYSVNLYEIVVDGIHHSFHQQLVLPNAKMSARVNGLSTNKIYSISIRSMSEKEHWSLFSPKVCVCTLKGMELMVSHYYENFASIAWNRQSQSVSEHAKYLLKLRDNIAREAEQHDRKERFEMEQERLALEAIGEGDDAKASINAFQERGRQLEHYMASVAEMTHCLTPEHVQFGKADVSGYQLQLHGSGGTPFISGTQHLMQTVKKRQGARKKASRGLSNAGSTSIVPAGGPMLNPLKSISSTPGDSKRASGVGRSAHGSRHQSVLTVGGVAGEGSVATQPDDADPTADDTVLLDSKINPKTNTVNILGLQESTTYELCVRARNTHHEWGPWSERKPLTTLKLIQLCHTRFGEHYINLYWHRIPRSMELEQASQSNQLKRYAEEFKDVLTAKDLESKKAAMEPAEYQAFVARLREWKTLQRVAATEASNVCEGLGTVESAPNTPVVGYHLRVIQENGTIRDTYFNESGPAKGHQFTATGLQPNTMYVAMLCADYGLGEWGAWSEPIRFMTQNLIQLQLTYVGESFIDIEWRRAPNKKLARADEGHVLINPTTQGRGHQYEVCIRGGAPDAAAAEGGAATTAGETEERRPMSDCSQFRIDKLLTDTKYQLCVREWDAKGEWGLWSSTRTCCTLAGMDTSVHEIGESWVQLSWARRLRRKLPNEGVDGATPIVQLPVEAIAYYLRVEELEDGGHEKPSVSTGDHSTATPDTELIDMESEENHDDDLFGLLEGRQREPDSEATDGTIPAPAPPSECTPDTTSGTRYCYVKKFNYDVNEIKLESLRPDTFYNVQVLCETTGGQLGTWSGDQYILSLSKIKIRTDLIDEQNVRLSWAREAPRVHPRLKAPVVTGAFHTGSYELEAFGHEKKTRSYSVHQVFPKSTQEFKLNDLLLSSAYGVRIRATDTQERQSLWSDDLYFATLKPLRVLTGKILEHHATIEWGRDAQTASEYPPACTPMQFGQERANQYHVRVFTPHERVVPMLDKQFPGTTAKFHLTNLAPNACYIVQARSCNLIGEWGLWSEERVVYTMKLVELDILAVGEDFIKVVWKREEPDELQDVVHVERTALDDVDDDALVDETALKTLMIRKRFPLLDKPTDKHAQSAAVYASSRTTIQTYTLSITKRGETEDIVMEVPATFSSGRFTSSWTVSHLRPDTQYSVAIRAYYGDDDWGLWSERVVSGTMNLLSVDVKYIGEDYLSATWQRLATSYSTAPGSDTRVGKPEETLCYEFKMHDFSDVPIGEEAAADLEALFVRDVLVAKLKVATVKALRSNRRYRMCVRRWYHPIEANALVPVMEDDDKPLTEEQRLRMLMEQNHGTPGAWSDVVFAITLKDMVALVDDIAEDSLLIRWDRDPNAAVLPTRQCLRVPTVVLSYHVRIDAMTHDGTAVDNTPGTLHLDHVFGPEETTYKVPDLLPDSVYKVDVRCCTDKVWGQWSKTVYVVTLPKLHIDVQSIGEDYVSINWTRNIRNFTLADGTTAVVGNQNGVEKYHMDMTGVDHHFRLEKKFKASRTSYRVKHLEAQTVYHISIRSSDASNAWSLWSEPVVLVTLKPMNLNLGKAGEQFVHVSWERPAQTIDEYKHIDPNMQLGRTDVVSFHLCVFAMDQAPATAVVDKQFHGDVSKYRITTLTPNTSYIIIVRACNDESQWGLWSEERIIRTQRILTLQITGIGENYVKTRWEREEADNAEVSSDSTVGMPTSFHLAITSDAETVDRHFTTEECTTSNDEFRLPQYTTHGLSPDCKYLMALQPCYGNDEWGLWTKPLTFVTLNRISIMTTAVQDHKVELAWGRAQQSVELAADPNIVSWRGAIVRYQLLMRKVDEMHAAARRERERSLVPAVAEGDGDPMLEGGTDASTAAAKPLPEEVTSDVLAVRSPTDSLALVNTSTEPIDPLSNTKRRQSLVQEPDELRIERDIEVKQVKYVQTSCTIDSLQLNTDYHVQVRALDDANEWGCWTELLFDTPPPPPSNVVVRKSGAQFCIVTWDAPDMMNRYQYVVEQAVVKESSSRRGKVDMTDWKVVDTAEEPQSRIRAFGPLNKIRFRVKCCKLDRPTHIMSQYSDVVALSTSAPPEPVGTLVVSTLSRSSATIEWTKPLTAEGAAPPPALPAGPQAPAAAVAAAGGAAADQKQNLAYRVLLSVREQPPVLLTTTKNLSYTLNDLEPNTAYKVQVQTESDNGVSQKNVIMRFTTKAESDRTVSRAQAGQPPLGSVVSRPGTQEGAFGQETVRLPAIAVAAVEEKGKRSQSAGGEKGKSLRPKPPQGNPLEGAKRPQPQSGRGASPSKKGTSPTKRGGSPPTRTSPTAPPSKPSAPRPKDQPLPPVRSRQGAPKGKGPVEQFDFVEFQASDDEGN